MDSNFCWLILSPRESLDIDDKYVTENCYDSDDM